MKKSCPRQSTLGPAFTVLEVLISTVLLAVIVVLTAQMVDSATSATRFAEKQMDTAAQARIFLDRFGFDLNTMITEGGMTAIYYGDTANAAGNSAIGFVCRSRPRATTNATLNKFFRGAIIGYRVRDVIEGATSYPMVSRGDGQLLYENDGTNADNRFWKIFPKTADDLVTGNESILSWQTLGTGILRFHLSFLLDDGRIVQTPPRYKNFMPGVVLNNACIPIAFRAEDSEDPNRRFVVGVIAGVAVMDSQTRNLAFQSSPSFASNFANDLKRPTVDGQTPLSVWNANLPASSVTNPVRTGVRFYERMFTVN